MKKCKATPHGKSTIIASENTAGIGFDKLLRDWNEMKEKLDAADIIPGDCKEWNRTYGGTASWVNTPDGESPYVGK